MLTEPASVLSQDGSTLHLRTPRKASCSSCGLRSGCGQYLWLHQDEDLVIEDCVHRDALPVRAGDQVQLELPEGRLLLLTVFFYGLPLLLLLAATALAAVAGAAEGSTMLAALGGLSGGACLSRWLLRQEFVRVRVAPQLRLLAAAAGASAAVADRERA